MNSMIKDLGLLEVSLDQTVLRQMVHKSALTEVFLTAGTECIGVWEPHWPELKYAPLSKHWLPEFRLFF